MGNCEVVLMCQYFLEPICDICVFLLGIKEWRPRRMCFFSYQLVGSVYLVLKVDKLH